MVLDEEEAGIDRQARLISLPGVANNQATVQVTPCAPVPVDDAVATDLQCVLPPHVGGAAATMPATRNHQLV